MRIFFSLILPLFIISCGATTPTKKDIEAQNTYVQKITPNIINAKDTSKFPIDVFFEERGEFETKEDYKKRTSADPNKIYYYDTYVELGDYDIDKRQYEFHINVLDYAYSVAGISTDRPEGEEVGMFDGAISASSFSCDPDPLEGESRNGSFFCLTLKADINKEVYVGSNAYGASTNVINTTGNHWGVTHRKYSKNDFTSGKDGIGLGEEESYSDFFDILTNVPPEMARHMKSSKYIMRWGVMFPYGFGNIHENTIFHAATRSWPLDNNIKEKFVRARVDTMSLVDEQTGEVVLTHVFGSSK